MRYLAKFFSLMPYDKKYNIIIVMLKSVDGSIERFSIAWSVYQQINTFKFEKKIYIFL